jgi:poly-gamma-glutamate capsule biosynthesis protein CapA/YwtB (metallophosphatase superfamily)
MGDNIKLTFLGDMMFGRYNYDENISSFADELNYAKSKKFSPVAMRSFYGSIYDYINDNSDIVCGNLQTCITNKTGRTKKTFNYRLDPEYSKILKFNSRQVYNLANNHIMDYGKNGIIETINELDNLDINHVGAGINKLQSEEPVIIDIDDCRIGFLGATDQMLSWEAGSEKAGINILDYNDSEHTITQIKNLRKKCDVVVLNLHWGENWNSQPNEDQVKFSDQAFDAGANIIIGTSSHFPHNLRIKDKNKIIIYGLGDFIDDYALNKYYRNDIGIVLHIDCIDKGDGNVTLKDPVLMPIKISNKSVNTVTNPLEGMMGLRFINL